MRVCVQVREREEKTRRKSERACVRVLARNIGKRKKSVGDLVYANKVGQ